MVDKIRVLPSGLPGKMASLLAREIRKQDDMELLPFALTGPNQPKYTSLYGIGGEDMRTVLKSLKTLDDMPIRLIPPEEHKQYLIEDENRRMADVIADFTWPDSLNRNVELYAKAGVPCVVGTTGGDRQKLVDTIKGSKTSAVIATNFGKPLVLVQAMLEYAADEFPGALKGYMIDISESHQKTKKDKSGTATLWATFFNKMGIELDFEEMIRDEERQLALGVPKEHLGGHAYHWYNIKSPDLNTKVNIATLVNGRSVYVEGTLDAIRFLYKKVKEGSKGEVFSAVDVLRGK